MYCNCFKVQRLLPQGQSQTYPYEERPCLSKYWKIYFPGREISLALFYLFYNLFLITSFTLLYFTFVLYLVAVVLPNTVTCFTITIIIHPQQQQFILTCFFASLVLRKLPAKIVKSSPLKHNNKCLACTDEIQILLFWNFCSQLQINKHLN